MTQPRVKTALHVAGGLLLWGGLFVLIDSICVFQILFGIPCPGCGSTRAAVALIQGRFAEAFTYHPLIPLSLVILPYAVFRNVINRRWKIPAAEKYAVILIVAVYITTYVIRMILFFPHTQPMVSLEGAIWPRIIRWLWGLMN